MSAGFEEVAQKALDLSEHERAELAYRLLDSVGPPDPHGHLSEVEFAAMIERRIRELESGATKAIPADEVIARLREKYAGGQ